jgi:fluoride ion exporter CrcB/FEX
MKILIAVSIGGAIGAIARFQLSQLFAKSVSGDFIYNIMVANIPGLFVGIYIMRTIIA